MLYSFASFVGSHDSYNLRTMLGWGPRALKHLSASEHFARGLNVQDDCRMRGDANGSVCDHVYIYIHLYMLVSIHTCT